MVELYTAPTGTDPRDLEAWKRVEGVVIDHPLDDLVDGVIYPTPTLDDAPRTVSASIDAATRAFAGWARVIEAWTLRYSAYALSPETRAIISEAVRHD